ncbi:MAG: DUF1329 domain-containing protein, partial [Rhizobium sp.]
MFQLSSSRYRLRFLKVWLVPGFRVATLKPGTSHTFKKRNLYLDEDSWNIVLVDDYDN